MYALRQDLRYAVRVLAKSPGFTAAAVVALALGIGANSAIFSLADGLLVRPLTYPNADRLVAIYATPRNQPDDRSALTAGDFEDCRREAASFDRFVGAGSRSFTLSGSGEPERIDGAVASPGLFETLGVPPLLGRTFSPEEEQSGRDGVVVLHYNIWRDRFASDPSVLGRKVTLDGRPFTVVGVMPRGFDFPLAADLWVPYAVDPGRASDRTVPRVIAVARLKPGVSADQAEAEMTALAARFAAAHPDTNAGRSARAVPFNDAVVDPHRRSLVVVMFAAVGLVLLIGCANVANLQLARATARRREIAVRLALGASRWQIVRQLLVESVLLALVGGAAGLFLAQALVELFKSNIPASAVRYLPGIQDLTLDLGALGFSFAVSALAGVVAGLVPALQASKVDLGEATKDASKGAAAGRATRRARAALVVSEVALTLTLLVGSGLLVKHFVRLVTTNNGYDPRGVLTMRVALPGERYGEPRRITDFYDAALDRLASLPGVESAAAVATLPTTGDGPDTALTIDGRPAPSPAEAPHASEQVVSPGYFGTLRVPVLDGRDFADQDRADSMPVAIVSEGMGRRFWPGESPIGKRVKVGDGSPWLTIVGVVADVRQHWLDTTARATLYVPLRQKPLESMYLTIRAEDPTGVAAAARGRVSDVDPLQPVFDVRTLESAYTDSISGLRIMTALMAIFGAMALTLAMVGVYGVMAYIVAQRRQEVGIRMALGARPVDVIGIVVGQALRMTAGGLALGVPLAALFGAGLSRALDGAIPFDPLSIGGSTLMLCAIVALASFAPARRAARSDPADVLRSE